MLIPWSVIKTTLNFLMFPGHFSSKMSFQLDLRNFQQHNIVLIVCCLFQGKRPNKNNNNLLLNFDLAQVFFQISPGCRLHLSIWHHLGSIHATWRPRMGRCLWWHHRWTAHWCTTRTRSHESTRTWRTWRNTRNTCAERWLPRTWENTVKTGWWLNQPIPKICSSKWVHLPQIGMNIKKYLKPQPRKSCEDGEKCDRFFSEWVKDVIQECVV